MAIKLLPKVSKCFCLVPLPMAALLIAFADVLFTAANFYMFFSGMICVEGFCEAIWLRFLFLAPYAWLFLAAAILVITYFDNKNTDLLFFAILIKLTLVVVFIAVYIIIFMNNKLHHHLENGVVFLTVGTAFLFFLVYFAIVMNSWHATLRIA